MVFSCSNNYYRVNCCDICGCSPCSCHSGDYYHHHYAHYSHPNCRSHSHQHYCTPVQSCPECARISCMAKDSVAGSYDMFTGLGAGTYMLVKLENLQAGDVMSADGNAVIVAEGEKFTIAPNGDGKLTLAMAAMAADKVCVTILKVS